MKFKLHCAINTCKFCCFLFAECQDETVREIRDKLQDNVRQAIKSKHPDAKGILVPFFYTNENTDIKPSDN